MVIWLTGEGLSRHLKLAATLLMTWQRESHIESIYRLVTALLLPFAHSRVPVPLFRPRVRDFCIMVTKLRGLLHSQVQK